MPAVSPAGWADTFPLTGGATRRGWGGTRGPECGHGGEGPSPFCSLAISSHQRGPVCSSSSSAARLQASFLGPKLLGRRTETEGRRRARGLGAGGMGCFRGRQDRGRRELPASDSGEAGQGHGRGMSCRSCLRCALSGEAPPASSQRKGHLLQEGRPDATAPGLRHHAARLSITGAS